MNKKLKRYVKRSLAKKSDHYRSWFKLKSVRRLNKKEQRWLDMAQRKIGNHFRSEEALSEMRRAIVERILFSDTLVRVGRGLRRRV